MIRGLQTESAVEFRDFPAITREQLKAYAVAAHDPNPIHQDEEVARKMGLPGVIAHGMLTAGLIAERAQEFVRAKSGTAEVRLIRFKTRFRAMTFPGDVISIGGTVKSISNDEIVLALESRNRRGEVTGTAEASFSL